MELIGIKYQICPGFAWYLACDRIARFHAIDFAGEAYGEVQKHRTHEGSDKIYFVLEGRGLFQIGQEEKELKENEIAIAPSGQRHGVSNPGPDRLVLLVFMAPRPSH